MLSLLICLNIYIYILGERCWNFTSINMTVKSGNWMGWLHERLQSESQWKDSGRQQYLKRRKIKRSHEVWEGAFRHMGTKTAKNLRRERSEVSTALGFIPIQFISFFFFFILKTERLPLTFQGSRIGITKRSVDRIIRRWLDDLCL